MAERLEKAPQLSETQAESGVSYLKEQSEYMFDSWVEQIERRREEGEPIERIMKDCLDTAAKWYLQAAESNMAGRLAALVRGLFKVTKQDIGDYGHEESMEQIQKRMLKGL